MTYSSCSGAACKSCLQADDALLSWLESYAEVGATLVVYRVSLTAAELPRGGGGDDGGGGGGGGSASRHGNASALAVAAYHDAVLTLYQCARTRWTDSSGDSCQCMTDRNDFLSTLSRVSDWLTGWLATAHSLPLLK